MPNYIAKATGGTLRASNQADTITGSAVNDILWGLGGNDTINGGNGDDVIEGDGAYTVADAVRETGTATLSNIGASGSATLPTLTSLGQIDGTLSVWSIRNITNSSMTVTLSSVSNGSNSYGPVTIVVPAHSDVIVTSTNLHSHRIRYNGSTVDTESASNAAFSNTTAYGVTVDGDDILDGGSGNDTIRGYGGNDTLVGGAGADALIGGDGVDTVSYQSAGAGVALSFSNTDGSGIGDSYRNRAAGGYAGDANGDSFSGIENFIGSSFRDFVGGGTVGMTFSLGSGDDVFDTNAAYAVVDVVYGEAGNDTAWGGAGNDLLYGGIGNDTLYGEADNDTLDGGTGGDRMDGGAGIDTLDYSGSNAGVIVNLTANTASGGHAQGDVISAFENITGSIHNDTLTGNSAANILLGGDGNDTLQGYAGDDTLRGGTGNDRIYGGLGIDVIDGGIGTDTADYRYSGAAVTVNLVTNTGTGGDAEGDTLAGIENLAGSNHADVLTGDAGANRLVGRQGADQLFGGGGDDIFDTGGGYDFVDGGAGVDTVTYHDSWDYVVVNLATGKGSYAEASRDVYVNVENIEGSAFADRITGDANVNRLAGLAGDDTIDGGAGNDILVGGAGGDTLIGGAGDRDAASYQDALLGVVVNLALGGTGGEAAGDTYSGIEYVYGSASADQITGDAAINRLTGGAGNDVLDGAAGNDYILGDAGNDTLIGGLGADVFVFEKGFGNDTISDFWTGTGRTDRVWLTGVGFDDFADVQANAVDTAAGVVITLAGEGTLTFTGVTLAQLNADDFIFS